MNSTNILLMVAVALTLIWIQQHKVAGVCFPKADLVLSMDYSGSVSSEPANIGNVTSFAKLLVETLDKDRFRLGAYYWAHDIVSSFSLADLKTKAEKIAAIIQPSKPGGTYTGEALKYAVDMFTDPALIARPGIPKILVWLSDGEDTYAPHPSRINTSDVMPSIISNRITIIVVEIKNTESQFFQDNIKRLTQNNTDNVINATFATLKETVLQRIEEIICYLPTNLKNNESVILEAEVGEDSFVCCLDINDGVTVNLTILSGKLDFAVYSFTQKPKTITKENNDGVLWDYLNYLPRPKIGNGQLCTLIVGRTHDFRFQMDCYQGDHSESPYNEEGL